MRFSTLNKNIEKCPFTYWLNTTSQIGTVGIYILYSLVLIFLSPAGAVGPGTGDIATPPVRLSVRHV